MKQKIISCILIFTTGIFLTSLLVGWVGKPVLVDTSSIARSAGKGLLLLEKSGHEFIQKGRCVSCHHNIQSCLAMEIARSKGIPVIDSLSQMWTMGMVQGINRVVNDNMINEFVTAKFLGAYALFGLAAVKYPACNSTDMVVNYLLNQERPDGSFGSEAMRVPLESGEIHLAALAIHGITVFAPASKQTQVRDAVNRTKHFLESADPDNQQEIVFQLLGLHWINGSGEKESIVAKKLISLQRADGGWSQLPTMGSDAYATGQALYALYESGLIKPEDEVYQKGIRYLLGTQDDAGAWIVLTRSSPIQPFFSSGFPPYDENQFISASASNWAVMALLIALPDKS